MPRHDLRAQIAPQPNEGGRQAWCQPASFCTLVASFLCKRINDPSPAQGCRVMQRKLFVRCACCVAYKIFLSWGRVYVGQTRHASTTDWGNTTALFVQPHLATWRCIMTGAPAGLCLKGLKSWELTKVAVLKNCMRLSAFSRLKNSASAMPLLR